VETKHFLQEHRIGLGAQDYPERPRWHDDGWVHELDWEYVTRRGCRREDIKSELKMKNEDTWDEAATEKRRHELISRLLQEQDDLQGPDD
jgi:hypothetical protein